jgi:hypothetical protein
MSEHEPQEQPGKAEAEAPLALDALPGQLGLIETSEMMDIRDELDEGTQTRE